jgi:hypothetical protein
MREKIEISDGSQRITMKSFFALVLLALAVASTSAFGGYTPVFASSPSVRL